MNHRKVLLQDYEHEEFSAVFLNSQHRVICFEELFRGTIDAASVYPREVVKQVLVCNAAAVILVHNIPRAILNPATPTDVSASA